MVCIQGVRLTKDLVGAPANFVTPRYLAETATRIAKVRKKEAVLWTLKEEMGRKRGEGACMRCRASAPHTFSHVSFP